MLIVTECCSSSCRFSHPATQGSIRSGVSLQVLSVFSDCTSDSETLHGIAVANNVFKQLRVNIQIWSSRALTLYAQNTLPFNTFSCKCYYSLKKIGYCGKQHISPFGCVSDKLQLPATHLWHILRDHVPNIVILNRCNTRDPICGAQLQGKKHWWLTWCTMTYIGHVFRMPNDE